MLSALTRLTWAPAESASTELHFGIVPQVFTDTGSTKPSAFLKGCCRSETQPPKKLRTEAAIRGLQCELENLPRVFHITSLQNLSFSPQSTEVYLPETSTPCLITTRRKSAMDA